MRKFILLCLAIFFTGIAAFSQDFSNKGTDFWTAYGYHQQMTNGGGGGSQTMVFYFATDQPTTITVSIPGLAWTQTYTSGAGNNIITSGAMPKASPDACLRTASTLPEDKGIHVTSDKPIVAYAHIYNGSVSGATILYPTNTLGKEYYSVNYTNLSNSPDSYCWFYVVATDTGTTQVEITPSKPCIGHAANIPFTVTMTQGQVYNVMGNFTNNPTPPGGGSGEDLTGSKIKTLSTGGSGCKRIAVFSGSGRISLSCNGNPASSDNYMVQALPKTAWGKNYLTIPTTGYNVTSGTTPYAYNIYRVCVLDVSTQVYVDGVLTGLPLQNNFYYEIPTSNVTHSITADKPIMVAQYLPSRGECNNPTPIGDGDPEVIYLSSVEQSINQVTWNACRPAAINQNKHYINVIIPNGGTAISSFTLDGVTVSPTNFITHPQNSAYSYAILKVTGANSGSGIQHTIKSDSGFNAIAYGYGSAESYGYNAGTNVKDLSQQLELETQYGIETSPSVCTGAPFKFKIYFPDSTVSLPHLAIRYDSLDWDLSNRSIVVPNNFPVRVKPTPPNTTLIPDSINIRGGKTVAWYSIPGIYYFTTPGKDTLNVTIYTSTNEGCGNSEVRPFEIVITGPPAGSFTYTGGTCPSDTVRFTETTPQTPKATYHWWWDFGDPASGALNNSTLRNPKHLFTGPGPFTVKYASITVAGCLSDTIVQTITIPDYPDAALSGNATVCLNSAPAPQVTFTGSLGQAPYKFFYHINAGGPLSVTSPGNTAVATISAPTNVAGTFIYTLDSVKNANATICSRSISGQQVTITINPLPAAAVSAAVTVCQNDPASVTFTGSGATAPYTFNYTINGNPQPPVTSTGNSITLPVNTATPGTYTYAITSVTDASTTTCSQNYNNLSTAVTVKPLPGATVTSSVPAICQNTGPAPNITFTGLLGTPPYTFQYTIDNGSGPGPVQTISTTAASSSVTILAPVTVVGTFKYRVIQVQEGSANACLKAGLLDSVTVVVNPIPDAVAALTSGNADVCLNSTPEPQITFTGSGSTGPYTFEYKLNGVPQVPVVGTPNYIIIVPTTATGTFIYEITKVTDAGSTTCSKTVSSSVTVTVHALPTATITTPATVCQNSTPYPAITFTGAGGAPPYIFTYDVNGGATQTISTSPSNNVVSITQPTTTAGVYNYNLHDVLENGVGCQQNQPATIAITVNELPDGIIAGNTEVCLNAIAPQISFTGSGGTGPYTFNYTLNGVPQPPVVGNPIATVSQPTGTAGTFSYILTKVTDASSTTCSKNITGQQADIIVHALPVVDFTFTQPSCDTRTITFNDATNPMWGVVNNWAWNFGDPGSGANNTSGSNPANHLFSNGATSYTVQLTVTTDHGCTNTGNKTVQIHNRPQAGFIVPEVCINDVAAIFTDTSHIVAPDVLNPANPALYYWDFGDGSPVQHAVNGTHLYTSVGIFTVTHGVISAYGCGDTVQHQISINGANPTPAFVVNNPTTLCANDSVAIVNQSNVTPGNVTRVQIWWDYANSTTVDIDDDFPAFGKIYKHLYPNFQSPLTKTFVVRMRAYSGTICFNDISQTITVNAAPKVQFNNMPNTCLLVPPFQITQASEIGGVPGSGVFSGPGVSPTGIFSPQVAGVGTHTIKYTYTSTAGGCVDTMSNTITVLDTAHAVFSNQNPICENAAASFTDNSTVPAGVVLANTVWDFGDGSPVENHAPGSTFTHTFVNPGTFLVKMYNVSTVGCNSTTFSKSVTVDPVHHITLNSGNNNQAVCINTNIADIIYNLSGGASGVNITGLPPGLSFSVVGTQVRITGAPTSTAGSPYTFNIQTTGNTCQLAAATGTITVNPDHSISLTSAAQSDTQSVCLNTAIVDIQYTLGGGANNATITGLPPGVTYTVAGNILTIHGTPNTVAGGPVFDYSITTLGNACVQATAGGRIRVNPYPVASFSMDKTSYCIPNADVKFLNGSTISDGSGMTYLWDFGDGSPVTPANTQFQPTHHYTGTGPYTVKLTARSTIALTPAGAGIGCPDDSLIVLSTIHPQPKADFTADQPSVCQFQSATFRDNSDYKDGTSREWHWDMGDGTKYLTNNVTHNYGDTTTYSISYYVVNSIGCNSDTIVKSFTVYPYPHVSAGPDRYILEGGTIILQPDVFANDPQYLWTPNQYLIDNKVLNVKVDKPQSDMTYRLTVTARGGCKASDDVFIKLLKFPVIPNTFTPNNDGINDTWRIDYLSTYPENRVQVFNRAGQLVFESRGYNTPWDGTIKGKPLPVDTYYYIIEPGNGRDPITGYVTIIK